MAETRTVHRALRLSGRAAVYGVLLASLSQGARADDDPVVRVLEDGETVLGTVTVRAPRDAVLALVRDPQLTREASQAEVTVEALGPTGTCQLYAWNVHTMLMDLAYVGRMCQTSGGAVVDLVQSEDFEALSVSWEVSEEVDGAVQLGCRTRTVTVLPVPAVVAHRQARRDLTSTLGHMRRWLEARVR